VVRKLREAERMLGEGMEQAEVAKALEVSEATFHRCWSSFARRVVGADRVNPTACNLLNIRRHPVDPSRWQVRYIDPTGRERSKTFKRKIDAEKFLTTSRHKSSGPSGLTPSCHPRL
jgi:hypothetical protein